MPLAGQRITAGGLAVTKAIKGLDESVTSSATLQPDDALFLPVAANTSYSFSCYLDYEAASSGGGLQWMWTVPSGATLRYQVSGATTTITDATTATATGSGAGSLRAVTMTGTLVVGATGGNLQLQWAQNSSSATATIVHAQSSLALS